MEFCDPRFQCCISVTFSLLYALFISIETISKEGEDALSFEKVKTSLKVADLERLTVEKENELRQPNVISFWCAEKDFENIDLPFGANIRFRTKGNGPFLGKCFWYECEHGSMLASNAITQCKYAHQSNVLARIYDIFLVAG